MITRKRSIKTGIYLSFLIFPAVCFSQFGYGKPLYAWTATYAANHYLPFPGYQNDDLPYSIQTADYFYQKVQDYIGTKIGSSNVTRYINRQNDSVNLYNIQHDARRECEFQIFSGHGRRGAFCDYIWELSDYLGDDITFGNGDAWNDNYSKWAFFASCLTVDIDSSWERLKQSMRGVHSIIGYNSISYQFTGSYGCGFLWLKRCSFSSWSVYAGYFDRWTNKGEGVWSAWKNSVYDNIYTPGVQYLGNPGVEPSCFGVIQPNLEGQYFDATYETFNNSYRGPVVPSGYFTGCSVKYGTPQYHL